MVRKNTHNEKVGSSVERSDDRIKQTGEVFTPASLCDQMVAEIPLETLQNPDSTFLDNSSGSGMTSGWCCHYLLRRHQYRIRLALTLSVLRKMCCPMTHSG
jgi:hypothetical protein